MNCKYCNNEVTDKSRRIFCSKKCKNKFHNGCKPIKVKVKNCRFCEKEFSPYTSLQVFCSAECRINAEKSRRLYNHTKETCDNRSGKNNPSYRNGMYTRKAKKTSEGLRLFAKNAKEIKQSMIEDQGFISCEICDRSDSVKYESHHIIFRSEKRNHENLHDKENIILLCIKCHNNLHKKKSLRNDLVKSRGLDKIFGSGIICY